MLATGSAFMLLLLLRRWIPFSKRRFCAEILLSTVAVCFPSLSLDAGMKLPLFIPQKKKKKIKKSKTPTKRTRRRRWLLIFRPITTWPAPLSQSGHNGAGGEPSRGWRILALGPQVITRASVTAFADLDKSGQGHQIQRQVQFWLNFAQRLISG